MLTDDGSVDTGDVARRNRAHGLDHVVVVRGTEPVADANLVRVLLAPFAWARWVVRVGPDDTALVDHGVLDALPAERQVAGLGALEAVAHDAAGEPGTTTWAKRPLERPELLVLLALGLVGRPNNRSWFRGPVKGTPAVRVRADVRLGGGHKPHGPDGAALAAPPVPGLAVLRGAGAAYDDFVRERTVLARRTTRDDAASTPEVNAVRALLGAGLPDDVVADYLHRLHRLRFEDVEQARELGFLVEVPPPADGTTTSRPAPPAADLEALAAMLDAVRGLSRADLAPDHPDGGRTLLRTALERTGLDVGPAADLLALAGPRS
ncbi:hypothetical protein [Nocardioides litoris]|uniref:hypothetical protein n=1 Tax=Nocardioides litoris TaxID=1926648 RepID=UPI00111DAD0F|nr:hypothetical protein [Nocardioides litoris]